MGEVLTLPEGAYGLNEALLLAGTGAPVADSILLVRWKLPLAEGTGQWVLLCRAFEAVAALQQVRHEALTLMPGCLGGFHLGCHAHGCKQLPVIKYLGDA